MKVAAADRGRIGEGYLLGGSDYVVTGGATFAFRNGRLYTLYPRIID